MPRVPLFASAGLMVRLDDLQTKLLPSVTNAPPTVSECDVRHMDAALKVFLVSSESNVAHLGLSVVANVLDDRALEAVISGRLGFQMTTCAAARSRPSGAWEAQTTSALVAG